MWVNYVQGTFSEFIDRLNFACQKLFEAKHEKYNDFFASLQSLYLIKQSLENFDAPVLVCIVEV